MPRYIDADALKDVIQQHDYPLADKLNSIDNGMFTLGIFQAIDQMPTISPDEVRGVVRCKDCKWCHAGYCEKYDDLIPWGCANKPWEDWFCADGAKMSSTEMEKATKGD